MNARQFAVIGAGLAAIIVVFLVVRPGAESTSTTTPSAPTVTAQPTDGERTAAKPKPEPKPKPPTIDVVGGQPKGGEQTFKVKKGDRFEFIVKADAPEEVHLHGYDISQPVDKGSPARFAFRADLDGIYEVELENSAVPIADLEVSP